MSYLADLAKEHAVKDDFRKAHTRDGTAFTARYMPDIKPFAWYAQARAVIDKARFVCVMAPPGSGKTRGITIVEGARRLAQDRKHRVGIFSKSKDKAENFMNAVASILKSNKRLIEDFGPFIDRTCDANTTKIRILGATGDETTPSVSNLGISGQAESLRFHTILMDDPIDLETAFSQVEVEKFIDRMRNTFIPRLEPGGQLVIIGSRFGELDGYHWILKNPLFKDGTCVVPALTESGESVVPERWSRAHLEAIRAGLSAGADGEDVSASIWNARYMQAPSGDGERPLKLEWHKWTADEPSDIIVAVDPAYSTTTTADYTAAVAVGKAHGSPDLVVRGILTGRFSAGHAELTKAFADKHGTLYGVVETNNAKTLGNEMRSLGLRVTDLTSTANKKDKSRLGGLEAWFKRPQGSGTILFHESLRKSPEYRALVQEYVYFPDGAHDHILDALAMALSHIGARPTYKEFLPDDYAQLFGGGGG
jgi:hypothetical protein